MISCTEFIPAYSELFKFIDRKSGRQAVYDYWKYLFRPETSPLNDYLAKYGLRGCWEYWYIVNTEEACDSVMLFNEKEGWWTNCMHSCPSKGRFDKLGYMTPFDEYCRHCNGYDWSLNRYGYVHLMDYRGEDKACCREIIYDPAIFKGDAKEMIDRMFACEMNGCCAGQKCILENPGTLKLITSPKTLKYLHKEFHTGMNSGSSYIYEKYGEDGLQEYLEQFVNAFHIPLIADMKEHGLSAFREYLTKLYLTEEAGDAVSFCETKNSLTVTVHYCPAVQYLKKRNITPGPAYRFCTSMVYDALARATGFSFTLISYDEETGAAEFAFSSK